MVTIGVRIDFYDRPAQQAGEKSQGYLGSMVNEGGFTAQTAPAVGESFSATSLLLQPQGLKGPYVHTSGGYPFLRVREVEHYPKPLGDEREAAVIVVLHAQLGYDGERLVDFVREYTRAGWHWMTGANDELTKAWSTAQAQLNATA
ncbi:hypothetical protein [Kitasatospora sp. HPMI-4]|uniref:hypothetical protein n=1 Tax=Kitasatospora sp. HPMI-4 TaxID=3448443 RepID=UPI003F196CE6